MNIKEDKILYESIRYACMKLNLECVNYIEDRIGKKGAILRDRQHRRYLFACKRYMFFQKDAPGIISFSKDIVLLAKKLNCILLMLIRDVDDEGMPRNYTYMFNPDEILDAPETKENVFNTQLMLNFPVKYCINAELTRRKEHLELETRFHEKAEAHHEHHADKVTVTLERWL